MSNFSAHHRLPEGCFKFAAEGAHSTECVYFNPPNDDLSLPTTGVTGTPICRVVDPVRVNTVTCGSSTKAGGDNCLATTIYATGTGTSGKRCKAEHRLQPVDG